MKFYRLLAFTLIVSGYNTQAQTDTTKIQENLNENEITDSTKAPTYNLNENGIIDFWKQNTIGHEVNTVGEEGLLKKDESTFQSLLSGRVAGVTVVPGQAGIGSSTEIYIRGLHSIYGNQQPLYIVDGISYNNQTIVWDPYKDPYSNLNSSIIAKFDVGSRIADISIFDIESIDIIQNSSALAIYGSKAANGAIIITTKKGKTGSKFSVSVCTGLTIEKPLVLPKFQNSYGQGEGGIFNSDSRSSWGPKFNGQQFNQFDTPAYGWVNGQLTIVRQGDIEAVQKAKDLGYQTDVFTSEYKAYPNNVRDFFETAVSNANNVAISGSDEKWNYRLSVSNHNLNGIVPNSGITKNNVAFNFAVAPLKFLTISSAFAYNTSKNNVANGYLMQYVTLIGRNVNMASLKEYLQRGSTEKAFRVSNVNPYEQAYYSYNKVDNDAYNGNTLFDIKILKNWHVIYQFAFENAITNLNNKHLDRYASKVRVEYQNKLRNSNHTLFTTFVFHPTTIIDVNGMAGITKGKLHEEYYDKYNSPNYWKRAPNDTDNKNTALFSQLNLTLHNTYFFEVQGRSEKDEDIKSNKSLCYSLATGASLKKFLVPTGFVSNASFRTSYGQAERLDKNFYFDNSKNSKEKTAELGFDLEFFKNHTVTATFYRTKSENNQIIIHYSDILRNLLNMDFIYHGINIGATSHILTSSVSSIDLAVNFNKNISKVETIKDDEHTFDQSFYLYNYLNKVYGIQKTYNGKAVYTEELDRVMDDDKEGFAKITPDYTLNMAFTYRYKHFSVSILCTHQQGGNINSSIYAYGCSYGTLKETDNREVSVPIDGYILEYNSNIYTPINTTVSKEKYFNDIQGYRLFDATYTKIKELSISYQFDSPNKRYFQNISVSLIGRNLLLLAKQDHFDPETAFLGEENFAIPTTRSISLQLTATF